MDKKLLKVWTSSAKKAIVCSSLNELVRKGAEKLNITSLPNIKAFLEDGTELDDDEIFDALPAGSIIYLLDENEKKPWEVSADDTVRSEPSFVDKSNNISNIVFDSGQLTSSPIKDLRLFATWPADFKIPTPMFSESLEKEAVSRCLSWSSKAELLKIIAEENF